MMKFLLFVLGVAALTGLAWLVGPYLLVSDGDMEEPRSEIHAARLGSDIYVAGGIGVFRTLDSCARFDTEAREWSHCPDLPRALHHVAMAASDTQVFASGGYSRLPFNIDQDGAVFVMEPGGDEWSEFASLPHPLGQHAMAVHEGGLYLIGGENDGETLASLWRLDLATREWTELAPMGTARHSHAIAQDEGALYVTGGRSPSLGSRSEIAERYDFASGEWSRLPDLPMPMGGHGAAAIEGRLHLFGGENFADGMVEDRHDVLDLTRGTWSAGPAMPEGRHGFATAEVDGTIWILGGGRKHGLWTPFSVSGTALPLSPD